MVEINNQRKAFSICWRGRRELITDVRKPKSWLWRHCRRAYLLITPITLANLSRQTKTQINRRRTLPASFPLVGCLPQTAWPERLLSKSQDAVALQQIKERGALPMIDRGDIRQAIDRCNNIWKLHCGALNMVSSSSQGWQPDCKIQKKANGTVKKIDVNASHRDYLSPLWLSASSSACQAC